jgi:PTH1 family peptidyl-tRNA hydrolase
MWAWIRGLLGLEHNPVVEDIDPNMKYLIVGLGNIGGEYDNTRHNIGFDVVDHLAAEKESTWKVDKLGSIAVIKHKGRSITLLKPSTYMNRSGKAVKYWMDKLKVQKDNTMIVVDDLHLDYGKLRMRAKGSDAGHNGLKDIQQVLGGSKYPRLKVGIGNDFGPGQQVDYVLGKWSSQERETLPQIIQKASDMCLSYVSIGMNRTMNSFNE